MNRNGLAITISALLATGCSIAGKNNAVQGVADVEREAIESVYEQAPATVDREAVVRVVDAPYVPRTTQEERIWLTEKERQGGKVSLSLRNKGVLTAEQIVDMISRDWGIPVTSVLPLNQYIYRGSDLPPVGIETGLRTLFGSMGLDYEIDDVHQVVHIVPMKSRSWSLNIGKRTSFFSVGGAGGATGVGGTSGGVGGTGSTTGSTGSYGSTSGIGGASSYGGAQGGSSYGSGSTGYGRGGFGSVSSSDNVWGALARELTERLQIMVPAAGASGTTSGMPAATTTSKQLFEKRKVGTFSINPETGNITVQAPHWILNDLDEYFAQIDQQYNTVIEFTGHLLMVTSDKRNSRGVDLQSFASFAAGKYGAVISNQVNGGITVSLPSGSRPLSVSADGNPLSGAALGLMKQQGDNLLQIFTGYMQQAGDVKVVQRPRIGTTSGVPGQFSSMQTDYYVNYSQNSAVSSGGTTTTGITNEVVPVSLGTRLSINPRYSVKDGLIRAQVSLEHLVKTGVRRVAQVVDGRTMLTEIPLVASNTLSNEVLLKDGDLFIVGGQSISEGRDSDSGITGLADGPLGGLFGKSEEIRRNSTYYFALTAHVKPRK